MERGTAPVCLHRRVRIIVTGFDRNRHFFSYFVFRDTVLCGDGTDVKCAILVGKDAVMQDWCTTGVNWCILDENERGIDRQICLKSA